MHTLDTLESIIHRAAITSWIESLNQRSSWMVPLARYSQNDVSHQGTGSFLHPSMQLVYLMTNQAVAKHRSDKAR